MGLSFENEVNVICKKNEDKWLESLPKKVRASHFNTDASIWARKEEMVNGCYVYCLSTQGYGVYDLNEFIFPDSCVGVVSEVRSCQSQDIDYVATFECYDNKVEGNFSPYEEVSGDYYLEFGDNYPCYDGDDDEEEDRLIEEWDNNCNKVCEDLVTDAIIMLTNS